MHQVAGETEGLDFVSAVPKRQEHRWAITLGALAATAVLALALLPLAGINVWQRLLNPFGGAARYTLAKLEGLPERLIVAYGEPFQVRAALAPNSEWKPDRARGRYADQPPLEAPSENGTFQFKVPGQTIPASFHVRAGDANAHVQVEPLHRPELLQAQAVITLPEYLGYGVVTQDVRRGTLDLLADSKFVITGTASRALTQISYGDVTGTVSQATFTLPAQVVGTPGTTALQWRDAHGLAGKTPFKLRLNVVADQPPAVECRGLQRIVAMLEDEVLEFEVIATDDYGVREISLQWTGSGAAASSGETRLATGHQQQRELTGKAFFAPRALRIGPQRVELRARASDYRPGSEPTLSPPYYIIVLDKTEHAKLVQREFDRLVEKLEELQRIEEALFERNEQVRREAEQARNPAEMAEKLAEQEQAERRQAAELQKLQEDLAKLAREALRNDKIDPDVVAQWSELARQLAELAKSALPKVAQALSQAQSSPSKSAQSGNLREALQEQEVALKKLAEALKKMNQSGEQMQAGNFVNRLRKLGGLQRTVGEELSKLFPETVGATIEQIAPPLRIKMRRVGDQQFQAQDGVKTVRDELGSFVTRTQQERYRNVHREMVSTKVVEDLDRLTSLLDRKVSQEGIEGANKWAAQLEAWAKALEPPKSDTGGGGGSGGGQPPSPEIMAAIMRLVRVRMAEEELRGHTRALDTRRQDASYSRFAETLSDRQTELRGETAEIGEVLKPIRGVPEILAKVDGAMNDTALMLARPQTDLEVIAAETEVVELLSELLEQSSNSPQAGNAAGMAAMLQALQQQAGNQPGKQPGQGSLAGGMTERENVAVPGDPSGNAAERRPVDKSTGPDLSKVPAEFREALQAYFEKVEL
jgi:hypothetical protein